MLRTCQIPCRFGLPSVVRGNVPAEPLAWLAPDTPTVRTENIANNTTPNKANQARFRLLEKMEITFKITWQFEHEAQVPIKRNCPNRPGSGALDYSS